ncbi:MAG: UDP-4-amino-4,6-dideoxy-N-acetyl-beta-L-altrosamine transaminase [Anaerohalosphaeraceae bacterium]|nr:UDP-4-amino-4,6-dideoxy-N-acetyl-beta-L-altrosamine transaminase [Anaerohalosphaeraceae bacterium]
MTKFLPYSRQFIDDDDIAAVVDVLKSDFLTQGPAVAAFEKALADYCGAEYAVAFSSGTAALHGAYFAAGLGSSDELITSPMTFLSTSNAALFLGARPVFVDVESDTGNIKADLIEKAITDKTKIVVPIHFSGHPVDMEAISKTAKEHNLVLIEDACHALGAEYKGKKIGNCEFSDMAVFSFHPVKAIACGEGGAVLTNNKDYYEKMMMFRQHGVTKDPKRLVNKTQDCGEWYYEMQCLGYNYRLTDMQAALGTSQLAKLDGFINRRREIVEIYARAFAGNDYFDVLSERDYAKSAWHLYPVRLKDKYVSRRVEIFEKLRKSGFWVQVHYLPVHLQPYYQELGYGSDICPAATDYYQRIISIPLFPTMVDEDAEYVAETIFQILKSL